jgi:hypothetical protein
MGWFERLSLFLDRDQFEDHHWLLPAAAFSSGAGSRETERAPACERGAPLCRLKQTFCCRRCRTLSVRPWRLILCKTELKQQRLLFDIRDAITDVYFAADAVVSLVIPLSTGEVVETAMSGAMA